MRNVIVRNISKTYNGKIVLDNLSLTFKAGGVYCLMGPSGRGKTTFLRILAGLEKPERGQIEMDPGTRISGVFQEDRLCDGFDAVTNVAMVLERSAHSGQRSLWENSGCTGRFLRNGREARAYARKHLLCILPEDSLEKPVSQLSGGMRRRVAIVRAVAAASDFIFMDEPFTGLDEENREGVIAYILENRADRTLVVVTHQEEDVHRLGGEMIQI